MKSKVQIMVWGAQHRGDDVGVQAMSVLKGLDVGHSAIRVDFPASSDASQMVEKLKARCSPEQFEKLIKVVPDENGKPVSYELYWSFWPGEHGEPHVLASLKDDIYWQRMGVPFSYDSSSQKSSEEAQSLGAQVGAQASSRVSKGLLGRTPYKLGPQIVTQYPSGVVIDGSSPLQQSIPARFTSVAANTVGDKTISNDSIFLQSAIESAVQKYESANEQYKAIAGDHRKLVVEKKQEIDVMMKAYMDSPEYQALKSTAEPAAINAALKDKKAEIITTVEKNEVRESKIKGYEGVLADKNQALADLLYTHNSLLNNVRLLGDSNFKASRSGKADKNQTEANEYCAEVCKLFAAVIEKNIPDEIANRVTHGLAPTVIDLPLASQPGQKGIQLESLLDQCGKLAEQNVQYSKFGQWNCSSTTAHLVHESLSPNVEPATKAMFAPNILLPVTPQQVYNRTADAAQALQTAKMEDIRMKVQGTADPSATAISQRESTLDGPRAEGYIASATAFCATMTKKAYASLPGFSSFQQPAVSPVQQPGVQAQAGVQQQAGAQQPSSAQPQASVQEKEGVQQQSDVLKNLEVKPKDRGPAR